MKKLLLVSLLMILPFTAKAESNFEICQGMAAMAEGIMTARQYNVDASELYALAQKEPSLTELAIAMIKDAFDTPRYTTTQHQENAIRDFKNDIFMTCITTLR